VPTHVVYIDDSGTKEYADAPHLYGRTGKSRYFVFGAVLISTADAGTLVTRIRQAKRFFFDTEDVEIKSNWLRIPKECAKRYLTPYHLSEEALRGFVDEYYSIIGATNLQLIASVVDKAHVQETYPLPWYAPAIAYDLLMQRVVQELPEPDCVSIVMDDMTGATPKGNQYKRNLARHHAKLRKEGSFLRSGMSFASLAGDLKFVNSAQSDQIQVADVVAYNVYRQFVDHGDAWEAEGLGSLPLYDWFEKIGGKFRVGPNQRVQGYGIVKFPLRKRIRWAYRDDENEEAAP
jgi:hypothetical protein